VALGPSLKLPVRIGLKNEAAVMERVFNEIKVCKGVHTGELQSHFFPGCARNTISILSMSVFLARLNFDPVDVGVGPLLPRFVYTRGRRKAADVRADDRPPKLCAARRDAGTTARLRAFTRVPVERKHHNARQFYCTRACALDDNAHVRDSRMTRLRF